MCNNSVKFRLYYLSTQTLLFYLIFFFWSEAISLYLVGVVFM